MPGCLTTDEDSRVHSCGLELMCASIESKKAVFITPVVTRTEDGSEVPEVGAGGGVRDLDSSIEGSGFGKRGRDDNGRGFDSDFCEDAKGNHRKSQNV